MFNDGAMIALSKDRVIASPVPNHWNLRNIFISGAAARGNPSPAVHAVCSCSIRQSHPPCSGKALCAQASWPMHAGAIVVTLPQQEECTGADAARALLLLQALCTGCTSRCPPGCCTTWPRT